jgi:hypothetical protein
MSSLCFGELLEDSIDGEPMLEDGSERDGKSQSLEYSQAIMIRNVTTQASRMSMIRKVPRVSFGRSKVSAR